MTKKDLVEGCIVQIGDGRFLQLVDDGFIECNARKDDEDHLVINLEQYNENLIPKCSVVAIYEKYKIVKVFIPNDAGEEIKDKCMSLKDINSITITFN